MLFRSAQPSSGSSNRRPIDLEVLQSSRQWLAQEKMDGIRGILYSDGNKVQLYNRSGVNITARFPEIARLRLGVMVLDGEIVARDGSFQTAATRDKQTKNYDAAAKENPCRFIAFDFLSCGGQDLTRMPLRQRLQLMRGSIGNRRNLRAVRQSEDLIGLWNNVLANGGEGIIAKQRSSIYLPGARANSWIKFKATKTVTCVALGYTPGAREGMSIHLALIDGAQAIQVGSVGTGWTESEGSLLKKRLDVGELFLVEIEALNRTHQNALRFPVFRGERTDLPISAASADQLALLPTY